MVREQITPDLPPNPAPYLTDWLFEIGPIASNGMGSSAIGWPDIAAWQMLKAVELFPWEAKVLRQLSAAFLGMMQDAKDPSCPAPFLSTETMERNREAVSNQLRIGFKAMSMANAKNRIGGKRACKPVASKSK